MRLFVIVSVAVIVVSAGQSSTARAECISIRSTVADQLAQHTLVFLGDVLDIQNVLEPQPYRERVRFRVVESFKGVQVGTVLVGFTPTAESFRFKLGQRTLVYATGLPENYSTQCTPTRATNEDDPEVKGLRELARRR